jgi:hypothetical protein
MIILEAGSNFSILEARRSSQCKEDTRHSSKPKSFELSKKICAAAGVFILNHIGPCTVGVNGNDSY